MGFKACHFRSARAPQTMLTIFCGEENLQKQIFTEEPWDFHVFHLYHCFLLRIKVSTLPVGRVQYTLTFYGPLHHTTKFFTFPTPFGSIKFLGTWVWIDSTSSPGSWECSGVCPKLALDLFLWMSTNDSTADFAARWNQHKLTCPFGNKHYIFIPGRSLNQVCLLYTGWYKAESIREDILHWKMYPLLNTADRKNCITSGGKPQGFSGCIWEVSEVTYATVRTE